MDNNPQEGAEPQVSMNPEPSTSPVMEPQPIINNGEKKFPTSAVVGIVILIAALVGVLYYFTPQGWPFLQFSSNNQFGISSDESDVLLFSGGTLFSFNPENERITELGVFKDGDQVASASKVAISQDYSHVAIAVPKVGGGADILVYSDFENYEQLASQSKYLQSLSVSNSGAILFSEASSKDADDSKVYFVSRSLSDSVESLGSATTPFFADGGRKIIHGSPIGYKVIDLEAGDSLETETPQLLTPVKVAISPQNNYFSLMDDEGHIMLYELGSTRPFRVHTDTSFPINVLGTKDMAISSTGKVAFIWSPNGKNVLTTVDSLSKTIKTHTQDILGSALLVSWTK